MPFWSFEEMEVTPQKSEGIGFMFETRFENSEVEKISYLQFWNNMNHEGEQTRQFSLP